MRAPLRPPRPLVAAQPSRTRSLPLRLQTTVDAREAVPLAALPASDAILRLWRGRAAADGGYSQLPRGDRQEDHQYRPRQAARRDLHVALPHLRLNHGAGGRRGADLLAGAYFALPNALKELFGCVRVHLRHRGQVGQEGEACTALLAADGSYGVRGLFDFLPRQEARQDSAHSTTGRQKVPSRVHRLLRRVR